jgi:uncharacterized membrane protein
VNLDERTLLVVHAAATWYMTGLIWFVQLVHYPLMELVERVRWRDYEQRHQRLTTWLVAPGMLFEAGTAILLWWNSAPETAGLTWSRIGLALVVSNGLSTAALQAPLHARLTEHWDPRVHRRLVATNWIRTTAWTSRALLAGAWLLV